MRIIIYSFVIEGNVQIMSLNEGLKPTEIKFCNTKLKSTANPSLNQGTMQTFPIPKNRVNDISSSNPYSSILYIPRFFIIFISFLFNFSDFFFILYSTTFDNIYEFVIGIFHSIQIPSMMHSYPPLQYYDFDFFPFVVLLSPGSSIYVNKNKNKK